MLFNSLPYIFLFLPITVLVYFTLNHYRLAIAAKTWLVLASLFFYGYWSPIYLTLILSSIFINFGIGSSLFKTVNIRHKPPRRLILSSGIIFNLALLGYFKYADFFIDNINFAFGTDFPVLDLLLPLAISFFTFQQIAYLIDCYKSDAKEYDFLNYCLFVCFFPQLIAGPIVHHKEMMPQFMRLKNKLVQWPNIAMGLFIFILGLFKKVCIADSFATYANLGFDHTGTLSFFEAWAASLSYTFQLYYDFSGYSDMAIGAALMFNIRLPINFNSPYKAINIQDFWRRWHITLSNYLRDYLYIPLGGNRKGMPRALTNAMITMLLGGLWHGAGWTFIIWGALHGGAIVIHRLWQQIGVRLPIAISWLTTFLFVNFAWVFFRAETTEKATHMISAMFGGTNFALPAKLQAPLQNITSGDYFNGTVTAFTSSADILNLLPLLLIFGIIAVRSYNSLEIGGYKQPEIRKNHSASQQKFTIFSLVNNYDKKWAVTSFVLLITALITLIGQKKYRIFIF